jgi:hypothetical protein
MRRSLDSARLDRVGGAIKRLQEFCKSDDELKVAIVGDVFLQGSVANKTVVRPLADGEFDVDAVYPIAGRRNDGLHARYSAGRAKFNGYICFQLSLSTSKIERIS